MERLLTADQKNIIMALEEMEKTPWRAFIKEFVDESIKARENILTGKADYPGLDHIEYSRNSVLREELKILRSIADYTDNIKKSSWIYQTT